MCGPGDAPLVQDDEWQSPRSARPGLRGLTEGSPGPTGVSLSRLLEGCYRGFTEGLHEIRIGVLGGSGDLVSKVIIRIVTLFITSLLTPMIL